MKTKLRWEDKENKSICFGYKYYINEEFKLGYAYKNNNFWTLIKPRWIDEDNIGISIKDDYSSLEEIKEYMDEQYGKCYEYVMRPIKS